MKISVIMACFNAQNTIIKCLKSLNDDLIDYDYEIIVCDDGSTDNTAILIESLKDSKVVLIRNLVNKGLPYSLNRCLAASSGEVVLRQDADDFTLPGRVKNQLSAYFKNDMPDVVGCFANLVNEDGCKWGEIEFPIMPATSDWFRRRPIIHASALIKRSSLLIVGGYDVTAKRVEDLDLWFKMLSVGMRIINVPFHGYAITWTKKDYLRKSKVNRIYEALFLFKGFLANQFPLKAYIFLFKPIVLIFVPSFLLYRWHFKSFGPKHEKS
ncbi:MAG: hypothetical protein COW01_03625 [Bdellovibrionales bacterium CG12_big_fil_rev_8_21_14_0_65_38_15]|nr:MAG: hypothetical protein COW79_15620 [Bdellovibrionales bacterium CG22_combo_CG10-13_8_21_14_all_38_13]PIQ56792.1 MAG: hypothetical protein COW01_03625 [Bdellovibrionales bacterium CG12_big_fil_rev_8_21_14_0_65_38_15]